MINPSNEISNPETIEIKELFYDEKKLKDPFRSILFYVTSCKDEPKTPAVTETDDGVFEADE